MSWTSRARLLAAGCIFSAALTALTPGARAEDAPSGSPAMATPVIAIVDVDEIYQESSAAKSARSQAEKYQQSFQEEITREENTLRGTQQELEQQRKTLSPEAFGEKGRAFEGKVADFQRKGLARRRALDKSMNAAMAQVNQAMLEATRQVATSHGATMVLPRAQVLMFDEKLNITKDIIAAMDKKLAHVDFPVPKPESESAPAAGSKRK